MTAPQTSTLSRKDRRVIATKAAKQYGVKDKADALAIHEAYEALGRSDASAAAQLMQPLLTKDLASPHPYIVLGRIALSQRDGTTGEAFFGHALSLDERNPVALAGMGTALTLQARVFEAVEYLEKAILQGHQDAGTIQLFRDLMQRMGRLKQAGDALLKMAARKQSAAAFYNAGELFTQGEFFDEAAHAFSEAHKLAPTPHAHKLGRLKAAMFTQDYATVLRDGERLLAETGDGEIATMVMNAMRVCGEFDAALRILEEHDFDSLIHYQRALAVKSNVHQDRLEEAEAEAAYKMAMSTTDEEREAVAKAYGAFRLRQGDFRGGADLYADRHPASNRGKIPYENSSEENLRSIDRALLIAEQGMGDQLALLPQAVHALNEAGLDSSQITFMGEHRLVEVLRTADKALPIHSVDEKLFSADHYEKKHLIFIGDLVRHRTRGAAAQRLGGYLKAAAPVADYRERAAGRPVIGVSWGSKGTLSGHLRSIPLETILAYLPANAVVVNLQYGDTHKELTAAARAYPNMLFINDDTVDQMSDMNAFLNQIAGCDAVVTIDNTTAHAAGALGHANAHVLIPTGSETMWYWGHGSDQAGANDPWYGTLRLHRQGAQRDWLAALESLKSAIVAA